MRPKRLDFVPVVTLELAASEGRLIRPFGPRGRWRGATRARTRGGCGCRKAADTASRDEQRLAELGLQAGAARAPGRGFTNFAISFTIISVLAGTASRRSHSRGRTAGRSRSRSGWPVICALVLMVAVLDGRADLALPDRRRSLLVGPRARRHGLELVDRLVQHRRPGRHRRLGGLRCCAFFLNATVRALLRFGIFGIVNFADDQHMLAETSACSC